MTHPGNGRWATSFCLLSSESAAPDAVLNVERPGVYEVPRPEPTSDALHLGVLPVVVTAVGIRDD